MNPKKQLTYKIFVINMPDQKERFQHISSQLKTFNLPFQKIDGVNISNLSNDELNKYYSLAKNRKLFPRKLTAGEIGCYIAHVKCWEEIIKQNIDFGIILEDDIRLDVKFLKALEFIDEHFDKWEFIRLQVETKPRLLYQKEDFKDFSFYEFIRTSGCLWGYALKNKTAQTLLKNILPFGMPADSNMHIYYKFNIDVKTLVPPVIFAGEGNFGSNIESFGKRSKLQNFYPFARQVFSLKAYLGRCFQLTKRDGIFNALLSIFKSKKNLKKLT